LSVVGYNHLLCRPFVSFGKSSKCFNLKQIVVLY
jgi:hypothetical protein